ncbi:unnamed protein product, partial [marine sediment metagenome]
MDVIKMSDEVRDGMMDMWKQLLQSMPGEHSMQIDWEEMDDGRKKWTYILTFVDTENQVVAD